MRTTQGEKREEEEENFDSFGKKKKRECHEWFEI